MRNSGTRLYTLSVPSEPARAGEYRNLWMEYAIRLAIDEQARNREHSGPLGGLQSL